MTDAGTRAIMVSSSSNEPPGGRRQVSLRAQNPEVYYSDDAIVTADDATIAVDGDLAGDEHEPSALDLVAVGEAGGLR